MKIRIETEGNYQSGLGHLVRMQTLATELAEKCLADVNVVTTPRAYYHEDLVVVDMATEDKAIAKAMRARSELPNAKIVLFKNDDRWSEILGVDLFIPVGFDNVILNKVFRHFNRDKLNTEVSIIFINQGGSDPWGVTPRVLHAIEYLSVDYTIFIIMGNATHEMTLQQVTCFSKYSQLAAGVVYYDLSPEDMAAVMGKSDLAITAPGQTFAELTAMSVPSIIIGHHAQHDKIGMELHRKGVALYLGVGPELRDVELLDGIKGALKIMNSPSRRKDYVDDARRVVNTHGVDKVIEMIEEIL
jgi:spore coat polysaccharide biosynthesis predicted glycosyltransferase SpsG